MQGDGKGWLYAPQGLIDGPMPTHYEPVESPFRNPLYGQQANPTRKVYRRNDNPLNPAPPEEHSDVFPFVFTTSRLTEHHTAGGHEPLRSRTSPSCSRRCSSRCPRSWRGERGLEHLGWATSSPPARRSRRRCW